jgi:2-keto-4-pentenoate hydratase/2-oxohepta-3-ene-1,7-dioic acid hydratase in catechol pathway
MSAAATTGGRAQNDRSGPRFALGTFADGGTAIPALVVGDRAHDLRRHAGPSASVRLLLEAWDDSLPWLERLARELNGRDEGHALSDLRPLPPVQPPGQIFQAGANYNQHVLDLMAAAARRGDESDGLDSATDRDAAAAEQLKRARSGNPFVFLSSAHTMIGADDDVVLPYDCEQPDWEIELAAVIGRRARRLSPEHALDAVAGYTICNDLTSRDALSRPDAPGLGIDWLAGKNSPTFLPTGPVLVPATKVANPLDLRLRLSVNGEVMQDDTTAEMLFDVAALIAYVSSIAELRPGDYVLTGSPAGNGASHGRFLRPGDVIEAAIDGLGRQRNRCVAERPDAASASGLANTHNLEGEPS